MRKANVEISKLSKYPKSLFSLRRLQYWVMGWSLTQTMTIHETSFLVHAIASRLISDARNHLYFGYSRTGFDVFIDTDSKSVNHPTWWAFTELLDSKLLRDITYTALVVPWFQIQTLTKTNVLNHTLTRSQTQPEPNWEMKPFLPFSQALVMWPPKIKKTVFRLWLLRVVFLSYVIRHAVRIRICTSIKKYVYY